MIDLSKRNIVQIYYKINSETKDRKENVYFFGSGRWDNMNLVDTALITFCVEFKQGKYLPVNVKTGFNDSGMPVLTCELWEPHLLPKDKYINLYVGSIIMRKIDRWAYCMALMEKNPITIKLSFDDGTETYIHVQKNDIREIEARAHRAISSLRSNCEYTLEIENSKSYTVNEISPNGMDIALHDMGRYEKSLKYFSKPQHAEKFYLERANILLEKGEQPYPFAKYQTCEEEFFISYVGEDNFHAMRRLMDENAKKLYRKIEVTDSKLDYGDLSVHKTGRIIEMMQRLDIKYCDILTMYGRYLSINRDSNAQFTMTAEPYALALKERWNVNYEGFSAPFNNRHKTFSSLLYDVDHLFGSVGPFTAKNILDNQDVNMSINPPFTEYFYKLVKENIEEAFLDEKIRKDLLIFIKIPDWKEEESIDWFKGDCKNPYLVDHLLISNGSYYFERLNGNYLYQLGGNGNMLFSIISPLGKKHPHFKKKQTEELERFFQRSLPRKVKLAALNKKPYVDRYSMPEHLHLGLNTIWSKIQKGEFTTKLNYLELSKLFDEIKNE